MSTSTARALVSIAAIAVLATPIFAGSLEYPKTKRVDHYDDYHGTKVHDPYRWLEDDVRESRDVADWVIVQNEVTFAYLESIPERDAIRERLTELWDCEKLDTPWKKGGRYFYSKNDGLQNQSVLYVTDSWDEAPRVLLDPNTWSDDGTIALAGNAASPDGRYLAYGVAEAGSDWRHWKVVDIDSGEVLDDRLDWVKFSSVEWTPDSKGFFYGRYDAPEAGTEYQGLNLNQKLHYHRIGTPQADDILVYQTPEHPEWGFGTHVTEDGRYLVISTWKGTDDRNRVTYKDLTEPLGMPLDLIDHFDNEYTFIGSNGTTIYFRTDLEAPRRRVIAIDLRRPQPDNWREVIAESPDTLQWSRFVGNMFILGYLHDAKTAVRLYTEDGRFVREVSLPGIGTAHGFWGQRADTETFYNFSSFNIPTSIYRYDLITGTSELLQRANVGINPDDFEVKQVFYDSRDGTKVPMFIVHRKGIELDGSNPTLLYGYGGFDISQVPRFSISRLAWMEMGGVFALANLRGGGEYGAEWHKAGTRLQKQNVFDDFIAAAEYLIETKYTSTEKLAIQGGSNGGLLVGAAMTQRPELFGAALPAVGVMDMLRFHKFTAGRFWTDDYGSSEDPEEFEALYAYSPYHNLEKGTEYPPTLVTTADTDDRVVPGHSFKFASQLQWAHKGDNPVLIRIETRAGHGAGKPTSKRIEQIADQWAFLVESLGMEIGPKVESAMSHEGM
jgi:prolyl oligopeptidase